MSFEKLINFWDAEHYDKTQTQTNDVEFIRELLTTGGRKKIFEICCGSGRILLPLSRDGHDMYGIDINNQMLSRLFLKSDNIDNIHIQQGNAITSDWGSDYDVVIMACNIIINIEYSDDYKGDQYRFIKKAYDAVTPAGYFLMDNQCLSLSATESCFSGTPAPKTVDLGQDSKGVKVKTTPISNSYDKQARIWKGARLWEVTDVDGKVYTKEISRLKHIPTRQQMIDWVKHAGFKIIHEWGDYDKNPVSDKTYRQIIWAQKPVRD